MPIYEYECVKCGRVAEIWQRITDTGPTKCERCKGKMRKLISQSSFHLKGTGWYVTDYKSTREKEKKKSSVDAATQTKAGQEKPKKEASSGGAKSTDE
jgi:putative FmdB family regulatory protein